MVRAAVKKRAREARDELTLASKMIKRNNNLWLFQGESSRDPALSRTKETSILDYLRLLPLPHKSKPGNQLILDKIPK